VAGKPLHPVYGDVESTGRISHADAVKPVSNSCSISRRFARALVRLPLARAVYNVSPVRLGQANVRAVVFDFPSLESESDAQAQSYCSRKPYVRLVFA
jgi:hypothetical protein